MLWNDEFSTTVSKISILEDTEFHYFFEDSAVFRYFYPRHFTNGKFKTCEPYHFFK